MIRDLPEENNEENINIVSSMTMEVSGLTDGTLTVFVNGVQQGVYSPSADTEFWLSAITRVTGKDVILEDYVMSSATTEDDLLIKDTDTVNDAFGKIQKQALDNEAVISTALNELNRRLNGITAGTGGDVSALSASVVTNKANITNLSAATTAISQNLSNLSAVTLTGVSVTMDGSPVQVNVANHVASFSLTSGTENYFDGAEYVSSAKTIVFRHGNDIKDTIDATDFIKDGMVDNVTIDTPTSGPHAGVECLIITFNADVPSGKEDIEIPIADIFDPNDYYNKEDINAYSAETKEYIDAVSGLTDGVLTLQFNEHTQGVYSPSADTTVDFVVGGDDIVISGYVMSELSNLALEISSADTVSEAFGKIQKQIIDNEYATAQAINELSGGSVSAVTVNGEVHVRNGNVIDLGIISTEETPCTTDVDGNGNVVTELYIDDDNDHKIIYYLGFSAVSTDQHLELSANTVAAIEKLSGDVIDEIIKDELACAAAFNDLNVRVEALSAGTLQLSADTVEYIHSILTGSGQWDPSILDDFYTKTEINEGVSAVTEILSGGLYALSGYVVDLVPGGGGVSDVKVNGTSVVTNNVAEITALTAETPVTTVKSGTNNGNVIGTITVDSTNKHQINYTVVSAATAAQLKSLSAGTIQLSANTVNYVNLVSGNIETVINSMSLTYTTAGTGNVLASLGVNGHQITGNLFSAASADQLLKLSATTVRHETDLYALSAGVIDNEYVIQQTFNSLQGSLTGLSAATTALSSYTHTVMEPKVRKRFTTTNNTTIDITKQLTVMTITGSNSAVTITITDTSDALDELNLESGEFSEVHVIVQNGNGNVDREISFNLSNPGNASIVCTTGNSMFIPAGDYGEVNALITYDGTNYVIYVITT